MHVLVNRLGIPQLIRCILGTISITAYSTHYMLPYHFIVEHHFASDSSEYPLELVSFFWGRAMDRNRIRNSRKTTFVRQESCGRSDIYVCHIKATSYALGICFVYGLNQHKSYRMS